MPRGDRNYYVSKGSQRFAPQPKTGMGEVMADRAVQAVRDALKSMGVTIRVLDGNEGYQALNERGLVRYQWRTVDELRQQMYAEHGEIAPARVVEPEREQERHDMAREKRTVIEPCITRIDFPTGAYSFEVSVGGDGKLRYGGRHPSIEKARAKRDELLSGRPLPKMHRRKGKTSNALETSDPGAGTPDEVELVRLFSAWQAARRAYTDAWFKTDELRKELDEKAAALRSFLVERGKVER